MAGSPYLPPRYALAVLESPDIEKYPRSIVTEAIDALFYWLWERGHQKLARQFSDVCNRRLAHR